MFICTKSKTIHNVLRITAPSVDGGSDILVGQVYCTIEKDTVNITKDIWREDIYTTFATEIEGLIYDFEVECKKEIIAAGFALEAVSDALLDARVKALEDELKITNEKLNTLLPPVK